MNDIRQMDLFSVKLDLKIAKITEGDVQVKTDRLKQFINVVEQHENMYPGINKWLKRKVLPGIKDGERVAYLGSKNNEPFISAVVKKGKVSKFCHLHIHDEMRNNQLGELFFSMMAVDVRNKANSVYFTLPESLWMDKKGFFNSFGFSNATKSKIQYRSFEEELHSSSTFSDVWLNVCKKLPKVITSLTPSNENIFTGLLLSIKPEYLERMESGEKIIEIRKKFSTKWRKCRATLYSSSPMQELYGHATIDEVYKGKPKEIWNKFESGIGCTKKQYEEYIDSVNQIYAIKLRDFKAYHSPIYLRQISSLINDNEEDLKPPQSYLSIKNNKKWTEAIALAELLHGRFQLYTSLI